MLPEAASAALLLVASLPSYVQCQPVVWRFVSRSPLAGLLLGGHPTHGHESCCRFLRLCNVKVWWLWSQVSSATGADKLSEALYDCDLVVIPAGVPRKPGMTRDDLFNINAGAAHL